MGAVLVTAQGGAMTAYAEFCRRVAQINDLIAYLQSLEHR